MIVTRPLEITTPEGRSTGRWRCVEMSDEHDGAESLCDCGGRASDNPTTCGHESPEAARACPVASQRIADRTHGRVDGDVRVRVLAARAAHEANNIYSAALGDPLSPPWDELTEAQRDGIFAGAAHALAGGSPEDSHRLWMQTRAAEGWTFGPRKDFAAKTSPCMVPYAELPEAQRRKDALFQGVVRAVATALKGAFR